MGRTPSVSLPDEYVKTVDRVKGKAGCVNRSEFIRRAIRNELDRLDIDAELPDD